MGQCFSQLNPVWDGTHEESMKMLRECMWTSRPASGRHISLRSESVADLRIGKQVSGRGGGVTELFPQLPDKSTEILQLAAVFRPPDRSKDARVGKRKSGVRHQKMKQFEFLGCEMNWCPRPFHLAPGRVQLDVSNPDGGGLV